MIEAGHDVFASKRRILSQKVVDSVAIRQHTDYLVDR